MATRSITPYSKAQMQAQIGKIDLLMAMYPAEDELTVDADTRSCVEMLRAWSDSDEAIDVQGTVPDALSFELHVGLDHDPAITGMDEAASNIQLNIEVPICERAGRNGKDEKLDPDVRVRLRQPTWMNKSQTARINASIPQECEDDVVASIEYIREEAAGVLRESVLSSSTASNDSASSNGTQTQPLVRVWFYFPSLSTRSKRNDLVEFTSQYSLTGFVLAGKPGILCLEGEPRNIDEYMRVIKTESWGDIPSHQKKVSERYREVISCTAEKEKGGRVFEGMQEITDADWLGAKRGERGNRSDLGVVEDWLAAKGLGGIFERVLR